MEWLRKNNPLSRCLLAPRSGLPCGCQPDQIAVPALGLSKHPRAYLREIDQYSIASHLVYGCVTEVVRRLLDDRLVLSGHAR